MTERVTTDREVLAAWPNRGRCWKLVSSKHAKGFRPQLRPWAMQSNEDYSRFGEWLKAQGSTGNPTMEKFHCFTGLQDALSPFPGVSVVQEFEYEGLSGIGHFQTRHTPKPLVVLLVEYVKPLNVVTLPVSVRQAETNRIAVSQQ